MLALSLDLIGRDWEVVDDKIVEMLFVGQISKSIGKPFNMDFHVVKHEEVNLDLIH